MNHRHVSDPALVPPCGDRGWCGSFHFVYVPRDPFLLEGVRLVERDPRSALEGRELDASDPVSIQYVMIGTDILCRFNRRTPWTYPGVQVCVVVGNVGDVERRICVELVGQLLEGDR